MENSRNNVKVHNAHLESWNPGILEKYIIPGIPGKVVEFSGILGKLRKSIGKQEGTGEVVGTRWVHASTRP